MPRDNKKMKALMEHNLRLIACGHEMKAAADKFVRVSEEMPNDNLDGGRHSATARFFRKVGRALKPVGREIQNVVEPAAKEVLNKAIRPALNQVVDTAKEQAINAIQQGTQQLISQAPTMALSAAGVKHKRKQSPKMIKRNNLMKTLMKEGLS